MSFARLVVASALLGPIFGCSDPVPPTPKAAWSVTFNHPGAQCPVSQHNRELGKVTSTTKSSLVSDGQSGTKVSCSVKQSGSNFSITGRAQQGGKALDIQVTMPTSATRDNPSQGQIAYASDATVKTYYSRETLCNFFFEPGGQGVAAGRVWVSFTCEKIDAGITEDYCSLGDSYAIFENCEGVSEED